MAYCTTAQVQAEFKELSLGASTVITTAKLEEFIAEADAEINAIIGKRYEVPVASGDALVLCRRMSRAIAAERVADVLAVKHGDAKLSQNSSKMNRKEALEMAEKIAKGDAYFPGATVKDDANAVKSYVHDEDFQRTFTRDEDQW